VSSAPTTTPPRPVSARRSSMREHRLRTRRAKNWMFWGACAAALALMLVPLLWVVGGIVVRALENWQWSVLTTTTEGNGGGLLNAILGTLVIVAGVLIIAGALGVAGGIYLAEYVPLGKGSLLRGASEVLSGVPSIVLGLVGYLVLVAGGLHLGYGLIPALAVLSVLVVPYVTRSTEVAIRNVPTAYREGAEALGMPSSQILRKIVLRPALPGIATGLIFAAAIAVGETAPLLYTAQWSDSVPGLPLTHNPVAYLTYPVYTFYNLPQDSAHHLAYDAAFLLVVFVLTLMAIARIVVSFTQKYAPDRAHKSGRGGR
jgi:phosphate transport system permease protein